LEADESSDEEEEQVSMMILPDYSSGSGEKDINVLGFVLRCVEAGAVAVAVAASQSTLTATAAAATTRATIATLFTGAHGHHVHIDACSSYASPWCIELVLQSLNHYI